MNNVTYGVIGALLWGVGAAVTGGVMARYGDDPGEAWPFVAMMWPLMAMGWVAVVLFIKPLIPLYRGVYRIAAGRTWSPPPGEDP